VKEAEGEKIADRENFWVGEGRGLDERVGEGVNEGEG
jgi:hypothetical protein